ncbi:MAG: hypothetical protein ACYDIA_21025 [Candidatus Humimicrobiaceae bacterium]
MAKISNKGLKVKAIYTKNNSEEEWLSIVRYIRENHARKYSFIPDFEKLVSGKYPPPRGSFIKRTKKKWD